MKRLTDGARLRRRRQLLARRPVDRLLVDARRLRPPADRRRRRRSLEENPSYFAEIYIMQADGSGQKRLTNAPGYDGGPFFTPDGTADRLAPLRRAGAHRRRLDDEARRHGPASRSPTSASMSWAPYMHPSGQYIIFASNKLGFENFELFIVDAAGHEGAGARHLLRRLRRTAGALARRQDARLDVEPRGRRRRDRSSSRSGITTRRSRRSGNAPPRQPTWGKTMTSHGTPALGPRARRRRARPAPGARAVRDHVEARDAYVEDARLRRRSTAA